MKKPPPVSRLRIASLEIEIEGDPAAVSEALKAAAAAFAGELAPAPCRHSMHDDDCPHGCAGVPPVDVT